MLKRAVVLVSGAALVASLATSGVVTATAVAEQPSPSQNVASAAEVLAQTPEERAFAAAAETGEPVEVVEERTEYTRTFADPDGASFRQDQSTTPIFGRDPAGKLVPIDTTLIRQDELVRPQASAVELAFPVGGSNTLSMEYLGHRMSLTLEGTLDDPALAGDTATYAEVFPGVDLKLSATPEGYRQVYVVKTRAAAANPALQKLTHNSTGVNGRLVRRTAGGAVFVDQATGVGVFSTARAMMWDSSGSPEEGVAAKPTAREAQIAEGVLGATEDEPAAPSPGDAVAEMPVVVAAGALEVTPSQSFLDDPDTVFPVFIDPSDGIDRSSRHMISSDGDTGWQFTGDEGMGKCPVNYTNACYNNVAYVKRLYYQFRKGNMSRYDKVLRAEFSVRNVFSMSCRESSLDVDRTGNVDAYDKWPGPAAAEHIGRYTGANGWGNDCAAQADLEFSGSKLTELAGRLASGGLELLTLRMRATDESDQRSWKRFSQAGVLKVWYARLPKTPSSIAVVSGQSARCATDVYHPQFIGSHQPSFRAVPQTEFNGTDTSGAHLRLRFQAQSRNSAGEWVDKLGTWSDPTAYVPSSSTQWAEDGNLETLSLHMLGESLGRGLHRMRVQTQTDYTYPKADGETESGSLQSAWSSPFCYFSIDPDAPPAPKITGGSPYVIETDDIPEPRGGPGVPGQFNFAPGTSSLPTVPVTKYTGRLSPTGTVDQYTMSGQLGTARVTPETYGRQTLAVRAWDSVDGGRDSNEATESFWVTVPREAGLWRMNLKDGKVEDSNPSGGAVHDLSLNGWPSASSAFGPGRAGGTDHSLTFSGAEEATTGERVLDTSHSFSISAWVYLKDTETSWRSVISQFNTTNSTGVDLRYLKSSSTWGMCWNYQTVDGRECALVAAPSGSAVKNAWTHIAGVYDEVAKKFLFYVNGRPAGVRDLAPAETPFTVSGPLVIGKSPTWTFKGLVDEVRVWNTAVDEKFMLSRATYDDQNPYDGTTPDSDPETGQSLNALVASWDAQLDGMIDQSFYGRGALSMSADGVRYSAQDGMILDGQTGKFSGAGPYLDSKGSFTLSATVDVDEDKLVAAEFGDRIRIMGQSAGVGKSTWALWFTKLSQAGGSTVKGSWTLGRWDDPVGTYASAIVAESRTAGEEASPGEVTVNAVYDSIKGTLTVYEGGTERGSIPFEKPAQGSGYFYVGWGAGDPRHFAGAVQKIRLWAGAMDRNQLANIGELTNENEDPR